MSCCCCCCCCYRCCHCTLLARWCRIGHEKQWAWQRADHFMDPITQHAREFNWEEDGLWANKLQNSSRKCLIADVDRGTQKPKAMAGEYARCPDTPDEYISIKTPQNSPECQRHPHAVVNFENSSQSCLPLPRSNGCFPETNDIELRCGTAVLVPEFLALCVCDPPQGDANGYCEWDMPKPAAQRVQLFTQESALALLLLANYWAICVEHVIRQLPRGAEKPWLLSMALYSGRALVPGALLS